MLTLLMMMMIIIIIMIMIMIMMKTPLLAISELRRELGRVSNLN